MRTLPPDTEVAAIESKCGQIASLYFTTQPPTHIAIYFRPNKSRTGLDQEHFINIMLFMFSGIDVCADRFLEIFFRSRLIFLVLRGARLGKVLAGSGQRIAEIRAYRF
jgi:hypothetical protein